ncbi:hypothetical protein G7Z17_g7252 [Cylindrodendrum hubeiense]|uniref:Uncharacterized protein n=1 Tax=Cylindrodendrum hubeiense TaxID=595255 RepID=A0A9P5HBS3_9HYPO|nr:hypothetical protein G7Z17_g7252 [Cylindrodendrum hubeiense]
MEATGGAPKDAAPYRSAETGGHVELWDGGWLRGLTTGGAAARRERSGWDGVVVWGGIVVERRELQGGQRVESETGPGQETSCV